MRRFAAILAERLRLSDEDLLIEAAPSEAEPQKQGSFDGKAEPFRKECGKAAQL